MSPSSLLPPNAPDENRVPSPGFPLPWRIVVSLRAGAALAVANILCVVIIAWAWIHVHHEPKVISVTGSARKNIESDLIVWQCKVIASDTDLQKAYATLASYDSRVTSYLHSHAVNEDEVVSQPISIRPIMAKKAGGKDSSDIARYELSHEFQITSQRVNAIETASRGVTDLIRDGVYIDSQPPEFIYTHLADLKIEMLAAATKDATTRAQQIATNSGGQLGAIIDARMGVMQINPVNDFDASDSGVNDTSSREKAITAVVSARFSLQ